MEKAIPSTNTSDVLLRVNLITLRRSFVIIVCRKTNVPLCRSSLAISQ
jgi:hypothetical protein